MYEVTVENEFSAAHRLMNYQGDCEHLHGHNWVVEMTFCTRQLDRCGLSIDFRTAKSILKNAIEELDHTYLNELEAFKTNNPSCENIAEYMFKKAENLLAERQELAHIMISKIRIWESSKTCVTYRRKLK